MYQIQVQYLPGNNQIWVTRLHPDDPIYEYDNEPEAQTKTQELQSQDTTGRQYRVVQL
jgi:hypothetical protein